MGTLEDFDKASAKVGPRLLELRTLQQQREAKVAPQSSPHPTEPARGTPKPRGKAPAAAPPPKRKRGLGFKDAVEDGARPKKQREAPEPPAQAGVPGESGQAGPAAGADVSTAGNDASAASADVSMADADASHGGPAAGTSGVGEQPEEGGQEAGGKKRPVYSDERTAFLKNLPWEVRGPAILSLSDKFVYTWYTHNQAGSSSAGLKLRFSEGAHFIMHLRRAACPSWELRLHHNLSRLSIW